MGLLDEVRYSARQLEDNGHGFATANHNLVTLRLLRPWSLRASRSLIVQLLLTRPDLSCSSKFVQERNGGLVVVRGNTRLWRSSEILDELEDFTGSLRHSMQGVEY
jgi:hypothetical protein